jgi:phosphoesterase RecJ-like protein
MMVNQDVLHEQRLAAKHFIENNNEFLIISHVNPDGDATSSSCAIAWLLSKLGKTYTIANMDRFPQRFSYIKGYDKLLTYHDLEKLPLFTNVIAVDCADFNRFGELNLRFDSSVTLVNIDHHATNIGYGHLNLIDTSAAATAQIIYEWIKYFEVPFDENIAKCIYTGLLTDTGGFRYQNTTPKVLAIASELLSFGVNPTDIARISLETITTSHVAMLQRALQTLVIHPSGKIAHVVCSLEALQHTSATADDLDGIVRYPVNIQGVEVGILFKQLSDYSFKVSFRSNDWVDVARIASRFGGGGHVRAAGCTIEGSLDNVVDLVIQAVELEIR